MISEKDQKPKTYVFYAFVDRETAKSHGIKVYTLVDVYTKFLIYTAAYNLLRFILKYYFDVNIPECNRPHSIPSFIKTLRFDGIYFSVSTLERALCVAVSDSPIGVGIQVPFTIVNAEEYAERYFHDNEIAECRKTSFDEETIYYVHSKKVAYRNKYKIPSCNIKLIDSTEQKLYTLHKDTCNGVPYYFAATGKTEFIKMDIDIILP